MIICLELGELKLISKHASMVTTQVEQLLKAQDDLLSELNNKKNDNVVSLIVRYQDQQQVQSLHYCYYYVKHQHEHNHDHEVHVHYQIVFQHQK